MALLIELLVTCFVICLVVGIIGALLEGLGKILPYLAGIAVVGIIVAGICWILPPLLDWLTNIFEKNAASDEVAIQIGESFSISHRAFLILVALLGGAAYLIYKKFSLLIDVFVSKLVEELKQKK